MTVPITSEDLLNRFSFHPATTPELGNLHGNVRAACHKLAEILTELTPTSREQSLALTHVEEAMFWANAAIARNPTEGRPTTYA